MKEALDKIIEMLKGFEHCRLIAYQDIVGVWTIGWGETLGVVQGMVWTQEQADERLRQRAWQFMLAVLTKCPQLHAEPSELLAACTSLGYNIGTGAFGASSVCRKTGRKDYAGAADSILLWNKARGRVVRGLTLRRQSERLIYRSGHGSAQ